MVLDQELSKFAIQFVMVWRFGVLILRKLKVSHFGSIQFYMLVVDDEVCLDIEVVNYPLVT